MALRPHTGRSHVRRLVVGGMLFGAGLGGFVDGILLHQILQWHHMLTSHPDPTVAGDRVLNVTADGVFHALTWSLTVGGAFVVLSAFGHGNGFWSTRILGGAALLGWGLFNLIEGLVDHHLLGVHHVHPSEALGWDLGYLAMGLLLVLAGWGLLKNDRRPAPDGRRAPDGSRD